MRRRILTIAASLAAVAWLAAAGVLSAQPRAAYTVEFVATWSASTHPQDFPSNPHFSSLIGGTHNGSVVFWEPGEFASDGIEAMAERGRKSPLDAEVEAAIGEGTAEFVVSGGGIGTSPGSVSLDFEASADYPLLTLVSMIAPSPDWFVGVHGLSLLEDGEWISVLEIPLSLYDAGTDSGPSYESPDDDTDPPQPVELMTDPPFAHNGVVGRFTIQRRQFTSSSSELPGVLDVSAPYPNPARDHATVEVRSSGTGAVGGSISASVSVAIVDMAGRVLRVERDFPDSPSSRIRLDLDGLPSGQYIIEISVAGTVERRSLAVVR